MNPKVDFSSMIFIASPEDGMEQARLRAVLKNILRRQDIEPTVVDISRRARFFEVTRNETDGNKDPHGGMNSVEVKHWTRTVRNIELSFPATTKHLQLDYRNLNSNYSHNRVWHFVLGDVLRKCDWAHRPSEEYELSPSETKIVGACLASAERWDFAFRHLFRSNRPRCVVLNNVYSLEQQIACEAARDLGIRVVVIQRSPFRDRHLLVPITETGPIANSLRMHVPAHFKTNEKRTSRVRQILTRRATRENRRLANLGRKAAESTSSLSKAKRYALFLCQNPWDPSITYDDTIEGVPQVLDQVIDWFRGHSEWNLIIRIELGRINEAGGHQQLTEHLARHSYRDHFTVVSDRDSNVYELIERSALGITISSPIGLEMLGKARPLVVLGAATYRGNGITIERSTGEPIGEILNRAMYLRGQTGCRCRTNAVLAYWLFHYLQRFPLRQHALPPQTEQRILSVLLGDSEK